MKYTHKKGMKISNLTLGEAQPGLAYRMNDH